MGLESELPFVKFYEVFKQCAQFHLEGLQKISLCIFLDELLGFRPSYTDVALLQQRRDIFPSDTSMRVELCLKLTKSLGSESEMGLRAQTTVFKTLCRTRLRAEPHLERGRLPL